MNTSSDPIEIFECVLKTLASKVPLKKKLEAFVVLLNLEIPIYLCCTDRFEKISGGADDLVRSFLNENPGSAIVHQILKNLYTWKTAKKRVTGAIDNIDLRTAEVSPKLNQEQEEKNRANQIKNFPELPKTKPDSRKRPVNDSTSAKMFSKKDQKVPKQQDVRGIAHAKLAAPVYGSLVEVDADIEIVGFVPAVPKGSKEKDVSLQNDSQGVATTQKANPGVVTTAVVHSSPNNLHIPGRLGPRELSKVHNGENVAINKKMTPSAPMVPLSATQQTDGFIAPKPVTKAAPQPELGSLEDEAALEAFLDGSFSKQFDMEHGFSRMEPANKAAARTDEQIPKPSSESDQFFMNSTASFLQTPRHAFDYPEPDYSATEGSQIEPVLQPAAQQPNPASKTIHTVLVNKKVQSSEKNSTGLVAQQGIQRAQIPPNKKPCLLIPYKPKAPLTIDKSTPMVEESRPVTNPVAVTPKAVQTRKIEPNNARNEQKQQRKYPAPVFRGRVAQKGNPVPAIPPTPNLPAYSDGSMDMPNFDSMLAKKKEIQQPGCSNQVVYKDGSTDMPNFEALIIPTAPAPTIYSDGSMDMPDI